MRLFLARIDHGHDGNPDGIGQPRPCVDQTAQVWVISRFRGRIAGTIAGAECRRFESGHPLFRSNRLRRRKPAGLMRE